MFVALRPLEVGDIPQVQAIEREAFPTLWPPTPFKREMGNQLYQYLVAWTPVEAGATQAPARTDGASRRDRVSSWRRFWGAVRGQKPEPGPPVPAALIVGYVGLWYVIDEAHITAIAARASWRGRGVGELLMIGSVQAARARGCRTVTLEVRVSNTGAQHLYRKFGFQDVGVRRAYYTDNHEDALIMTTDSIVTPEYQAAFQKTVRRFEERHGAPQILLAT